MAHVHTTERRVGDTSDRNHTTPAPKLARERQTGRDLGARRAAIRLRVAGVRGHRVPEEHLVRDPELGQHAMDDRGGRLGGPFACELALGGERDP